MARRPSTSTLGFLAVAALAVLGGWILVTRTVLPVLDTMRFGFPVYYTSSRLVLDGNWSPDVYDNAWFFARSLELTDGRIGEIYRPNTPVASLLAIPIASLDVETARRIWLVVDLALIVVTIVVLVAALPILRSPPRIVAENPRRENAGGGQGEPPERPPDEILGPRDARQSHAKRRVGAGGARRVKDREVRVFLGRLDESPSEARLAQDRLEILRKEVSGDVELSRAKTLRDGRR